MSTAKQGIKRVKRLITPEVVAIHKQSVLHYGNGSQAVRQISPDIKVAGNRAYQIGKISEDSNAMDYIDKSLQDSARLAVAKIAEHVQSKNEGISLKASVFNIEQVRGKAVQRNDNTNVSINIQSVLD